MCIDQYNQKQKFDNNDDNYMDEDDIAVHLADKILNGEPENIFENKRFSKNL